MATEGNAANRKLPAPDVVERLYWSEENTLAEIADQFDVSEGNVSRYMKRHSIPRRSQGRPTDVVPRDDAVTSHSVSENNDGLPQVNVSSRACKVLGVEGGDVVDVYETERGVELVPREEGEA